jgi:vancomycin permeability regulator SanA
MPDPAPAPRRGLSWPRWRRALLFALLGAAVFVLAANAHLVSGARGRIVAAEAAPARPVVIVPGNLVGRTGKPSPGLAERLETALGLYRSARARKILVSGLSRGSYDESRAMAAWLVARGVPAADVILDPGGHRTAATMADSLALGVRAALIATQRYHLARSLYLARAVGIDALGVPAPMEPSSILAAALTYTREVLARSEVVLEVAWRGVRP